MESRKRKVLKGIPISSGIVMGRCRLVLPGDIRVAEVAIPVSRVREEIAALELAVADTISELSRLRDSAGKKIGGPVAKVFDAQLLIAGDYEFLKGVKEQIAKQRRNAGYVYNKLVRRTTTPLKKNPDPYMQQMAEDIIAVSNRVLSHLSGYQETSAVRLPIDTILVGRTFTPGDILSYRNRKAVGFIAGTGGRNAHMALIARSLMAPVTFLADGWKYLHDNGPVILDGTNGMVIANPTDADIFEYQKKRKRQGPASISRIKRLRKLPPRTADDRPIEIAANLEIPGPADEVLSLHRIPIGLYRTEFLYLERDGFPDEDVQFEHYMRIAETYSECQVTLRTFDLGSDKIKREDIIANEENPALGWRGMRYMLDMPGVFKTQVRAMLRASAHGKFRIMLPMITDLAEFEKARKLIMQVMLDLRRENVSFDAHIPIGVMVEVPSVALMADQLARKVDFVSIGTNDLTQYTVAADRNNVRVANLYNPLHPSVLNLVKMTVDACHRAKIPVSICGEIAGDLLAVPLFIGMGVTQLSTSPARIFDVCRLIAKVDSKLVRMLVGSVMSSGTTLQVRRKLESYRRELEKKKTTK